VSLPPPGPQVPVYQTFYQTLTVVTAAAHGLVAGQLTTIAGSSVAEFDNPTAIVTEVIDAVTFKYAYYSPTATVGAGGTSTSQGPILSRSANEVTGNTATAHGLKVGYQVIIGGVGNTNLGGPITAVARLANVATVTTTTAHGFPAGAIVDIGGVGDASFDQLSATILSVPSATTFTYSNGGADAASAGGTVGDVWNGMFYIDSIPTTTSFTYQQVGANDIASGTGTMTPNGQLSGGQHKCVVMFQTRSGYITAPSPPVVFTANGGQYVLVSDIPIGPPNVIKRVLGFTGKDGNNFFSILTLPIANNQLIATTTVVPDNTTTSVLLDFSDNTLFAATAIDIPGNNLFALQVLPPCLGTFSYAGRLWAWGFRNNTRNFLNMGFDGGYYSGSTAPTGWTVVTPGGAIDSGISDFGFAWKISGGVGNPQGMISQPAYQDTYNIPILQPGEKYIFRCWMRASQIAQAGSVVCDLNSDSTTGIIAQGSIAITLATTDGVFLEVTMDNPLPDSVPSDLVLRVYSNGVAAGQSVTIDEVEIIPHSQPYNNVPFMVSYVDNFESFDGVTGILGASDDANPLRDAFEIQDTMYFGTSERLHETVDVASSEPSGWTVREKSRNVGFLSAFSSTGQQEQNGEDFAIWCTRSGLRIFEGGQPYKISQEFQATWDRINWSAKQTIWLVNDVVVRRVYVGVPLDSATTPSHILVMDYREMDTAQQISATPAVHISLAGRMIASDLARKWTRWTLPMNCGAVLTRADDTDEFCLGDGVGYGNAYTLGPVNSTDDNYGQVNPYWFTYFFVNHDQEVQLQLGIGRKRFIQVSAYVSGVGDVTITPYGDSLSNAWTPPPAYPLKTSPTNDLYWGLNVGAERVAFKVSSSPLEGQTDNGFNLQKMCVWMKQDPIAAFGGQI
jgi:hypothetical protein